MTAILGLVDGTIGKSIGAVCVAAVLSGAALNDGFSSSSSVT